MAPLPAGVPAPDFTLESSRDGNMTLSDLRGMNVVLAFYPGDWTPVCTSQLGIYNEIPEEFERLNARLLNISVDSVDSHIAYAKEHGLDLELLADFEPKGAVAKAYGVYNEENGTTERALFVIDEHGVIQWSYESPLDKNPGAEGILQALEGIEGVEHPRPRVHEDHVRGSGPLEIIEYGDFACPHCKAAYPVLKQLENELPIRVVFRHFPIRSAHPQAQLAHEAAEAAAAQGKFWEMHDLLFAAQDDLSREALESYARDLKIDLSRFKRDLNAHVHAEAVQRDFERGVRADVNGTPTLFIDGEQYSGKVEYDVLREILEKTIAARDARSDAATA